jgi:hypothetical protein
VTDSSCKIRVLSSSVETRNWLPLMKKTDEFADFGSAFIDVKMTITVLQASTNQDCKKRKDNNKRNVQK